MGLRGSGVQLVQGVRGLRGLAEAKLKKSFYKTFLKLPIYYRNVASDVHSHGRFMSYGPQGLRGSGVRKRGQAYEKFRRRPKPAKITLVK